MWQQGGILNWAHPFSKILGYERGSDITEGDIMEVMVYKIPLQYETSATKKN